jgi:hypothetical protein
MLSMVGYYWFTLFDNFGWNVIKPRGFFYIYFIYNFLNFIRCYMLEFKIFLHIHMIFNFQNIKRYNMIYLLMVLYSSLHKKNDPLSKTNYRPVSVLPVFSKIFEKVFETQLSDFFDTIFNPFLCAFRRGHGCQTTLLRLLEDWREALESTMLTGWILLVYTV